MEEDFGLLDWYRAKTVEDMRSDLVTMAQGKYFDNNKEYAFMSSGELVIRTGADLNDQAPEGPGPEEYQQMSEEQIVEQYVSRIKMYPAYEDIADQEGFAAAFLSALDNMNNVASVYGNNVQYGNGMELASEIQTGAITDYISTGFKSKEEFYKWYLRDVANNQVVLQPGQTQAEDFSVVDEGFYDDKVDAPNTRFEQRPETQADDSVFKQGDKSLVDKGNEFFANQPVGPITQKIRDGLPVFEDALYNSTVAPAKRYFEYLKMITEVGQSTVKNIGGGLAETGKLIADTPGAIADKVKEGVENLQETAEKTPSLLEVMKMLRDKPDTLEGIPDNE